MAPGRKTFFVFGGLAFLGGMYWLVGEMLLKKPPTESPNPNISRLARAALPEPVTPMAVLTRMFDVYSECETYKDSGVANIKILSQPPFSNVYEFKTIYRKPGSLLYQYKLANRDRPAGEFWLTAAGAMQCWPDGRHETSADPLTPFLGAESVTGGSSMYLPLLLMKGQPAPNIFTIAQNIRDLKFENDRIEAGVNCYVIRGVRDDRASAGGGQAEYTICIGREDFLVRRISRDWRPGALDRRIDDITFRPFMNISIEPAAFDHSHTGSPR